ncbi:PAS domain S-box protein [Flavobacterium sp. WC2430]|uniref:PAS domain S-box protein n=1 Tax=Flavobacterium sp. WC2430 TaxID=3234137 RepID=UPI003466FD47
MKISFEKKIFLGFVINVLVVIASGLIFINRLDTGRDITRDPVFDWVELSLFILSIVLLIVVYIIIRTQLKAKTESQNLLNQNRLLLQSIIDNTSNPIFIKKINGEYLLVNKQFGSLFKNPTETIIGKTDHDLLPETIAEDYRNSDLEVVKQLKELKTEEVITQEDGKHTYIAVKFPLYDANNRIYAIGGILTDITARKKLEDSLLVSDKFFNMSAEMMVIASFDKFIKVNPATIEILGYSEDELLSQPFLNFVHPEDKVNTASEVVKLKSGMNSMQFKNRYICKNGAIKWLQWSTYSEITSGLLYAVASDITPLIEKEIELKTVDKFFNMSLDFMVIAQKDKFIKVNPATSTILGYTEEELTSVSFLKYIHPDDIEITNEEINKLENGATIIKFENRWIAKDGTIKWLVWNAAADIETGYLYAVARDMTSQIETQKSLLIAEKFFNMSYDMLAVGSGDYFIKINPAFTRTLGYEQSDMDHKTFLSFTHPEDIKAATEAIKSLQKGKSLINLRARARCKDGTYKWLDWTSTIDIETGKMFAVARDVTEMVKYEESLKVADNFFDMAFDILSISKEDQFIKINPSFTKTLGYEQKDLNNIKFTDLIHADDKVLVEEEFNKLLKGTLMINYKNRTLCKDGTYKWLDWHCNYDAKKGLIYSVARDISEEIRLENEEKVIINDLYENEEKLRLILENIGEGVIVANANKEIVMANYMANEIFGIEEDENIPLNITDHFDLFFPDGRTIFPSQNLPMEKALNGEVTNDIDVILSDSETHERRRVLISGRPLIDQENNVVAAVVTIKDISKYKHLEEELQEAETKYRKLIGFKKDEEKKE